MFAALKKAASKDGAEPAAADVEKADRPVGAAGGAWAPAAPESDAPAPPPHAPVVKPESPTAAPAEQASPKRRGKKSSGGGSGGGVGHTVYAAKEAAASSVSVAALVVWTVAVTVWTAFQVIQNAIWYKDISRLNMGVTRVKNQIGTAMQASGASEEQSLWIILAIEAAMSITFPALCIACLWVPYIDSCGGGTRSRRTKRSFIPWLCTLALVCTAQFKLFSITSVVNKMHAQKLWCGIHNTLGIVEAFFPKGSVEVAGCKPLFFANALRLSIVFAAVTVAFHMLMFFAHQPFTITGKMFGFIPSVLLVVSLLAKPGTALLNFYYVQGKATEVGNFTFTPEMIVALISFLSSIWLSVYMGWACHAIRLIPRFTNTILGCCGRRFEEVYYDHERSGDEEGHGHQSYSLRNAMRSMIQQWFYMVQLPAVFGFVSPLITFASLYIQNWSIKADIILGAFMLFVYLVVCAFHRQLLAPPKTRIVVVRE